ncbi:methylated-DNA--[protein]-cysteine S-methyltransferase [Gulosibacter chungangensis]|uniref:methylated-DNA--[protein]-cysteine S-methyltransferase n=1 Tax=Gulosibacter chungangensis TaxID=979746 RepID=A0A7J5BAK1_9MICO|nr:methylated-DNA--[protein]-cysteine S-methyltransferase [Gulosibacter chungangensis]KAB1641903.1 methylated-DNA--[protein]-cysteine S-methyltransferase [Gulosibacter chungangensis]
MTGLRRIETTFGELGLEATDAGLTRLWLPGSLPLGFGSLAGSAAQERHLDQAERELREYFAGEREQFTVTLDWSQATSGFTGEVQRALAEIPYGQTCSYGEMADRLGHPRAARAVGTACSKNPLPIFSACHRVVKSDGSVGFYGGGEAMKHELLELEERVIGQR